MTFTYEELKQFILSQPLDREIDMDDRYGAGGRGCILQQFSQTKGLKEIVSCGYTAVRDETTKLSVKGIDDSRQVEALIHRALNCQVTKYSEVLHLL